MPDNIYALAARFRRLLLQKEKAAANEMVRVYGQLWQDVNRQIRELTRRYYEAVKAGANKATWLYEFERLQVLRGQVEGQLGQFARYADEAIRAQQWEAIQAGARDAYQLMQAASPGLAVQFTRLPNEALVQMVGFMQDGSPLLRVLNRYGAEVGEAIKNRLIEGLALGQGMEAVGRSVRRVMGKGLWEALRLARTETLRAYRGATHETYRANEDILEGWVWLSARNERTCAMCWAMDGTFHKLDDTLDDHICGRCTSIPQIKGMELPIRGTGLEAFAVLTPEQQLKILGPSKFAAFRDGALKLDQLIGVKRSEEWGRMFYERSLKEVLGKEEARKYYPSVKKEILGFSFYRPETFGEISRVRQVYQIGYSSRGWGYHEQLFRDRYMPKFKVRDDIEWTVGLWGTPEPSFNASLKGSYRNVMRLAQKWKKDFNQEGMALLIPSKGAKGGVLSWDFGRELNLGEMDQLLNGLMSVNAELKPGDVFEFIGLTVKGRTKVEFWVRNEIERREGTMLIERALKKTSLNATGMPWKGGYEFVLL